MQKMKNNFYVSLKVKSNCSLLPGDGEGTGLAMLLTHCSAGLVSVTLYAGGIAVHAAQ